MILHEEPGSVAQRMLWLVGRYRGGQGNLNYPLLLRLTGRTDPTALGRAVDRLVARHETLRTTFARRGGLLTQLVHAPEPVTIHRVRVPGGDLERHVRDEVTRPIDPTVSPIRVTLWTTADDDHTLCLNAHHLATDAWSCRLLVEELLLLLGGAEALPAVEWQYRHYVRWLRRQTTADRMAAEVDHWCRRLAGARPLLADPPPGTSPAGGAAPDEPPASQTVRLDLGEAASEDLRQLARRQHTTPFAVLLALYCRALALELGHTDLAVASPFANRARREVTRTVGFFANLLVLRTRTGGADSLAELVRRTTETVDAARAHQSVPYHALPSGPDGQRAAGLERVVFQLLPELPAPVTAGQTRIEVLPPELASRFDLELAVLAHRDAYRALFQFAPDRVEAARVRRIADTFAAQARLAGLER
jgi:hypothetical protein